MTMSVPVLAMLQGLICLCHCSSALLTSAQLTAHQDPQVPFSEAAPQPQRAESGLRYLSQCRTMFLSLVKVLAGISSPPYQPVQVSKVAVSSDMLS